MYSRETDAAVAELADAQDSKSCDSNIVSVRPRSAALKQSFVIAFFIFCILCVNIPKKNGNVSSFKYDTLPFLSIFLVLPKINFNLFQKTTLIYFIIIIVIQRISL